MMAFFVAPFVALALIIWAVIGLLIWIPLLVRASSLFTLNLLLHAVTRKGKEIVQISYDALVAAIGFYATGFRAMMKVLSPAQAGKPPHSIEDDFERFNSPEDFWRFIGTMGLMSLVFWITGLSTVAALWAFLSQARSALPAL